MKEDKRALQFWTLVFTLAIPFLSSCGGGTDTAVSRTPAQALAIPKEISTPANPTHITDGSLPTNSAKSIPPIAPSAGRQPAGWALGPSALGLLLAAVKSDDLRKIYDKDFELALEARAMPDYKRQSHFERFKGMFDSSKYVDLAATAEAGPEIAFMETQVVGEFSKKLRHYYRLTFSGVEPMFKQDEPRLYAERVLYADFDMYDGRYMGGQIDRAEDKFRNANQRLIKSIVLTSGKTIVVDYAGEKPKNTIIRLGNLATTAAKKYFGGKFGGEFGTYRLKGLSPDNDVPASVVLKFDDGELATSCTFPAQGKDEIALPPAKVYECPTLNRISTAEREALVKQYFRSIPLTVEMKDLPATQKRDAEMLARFEDLISRNATTFKALDPRLGELRISGPKVVWRQDEAVQTFKISVNPNVPAGDRPPAIPLEWLSISNFAQDYAPDSQDVALSLIEIAGERLAHLRYTDRAGRLGEADFSLRGELLDKQQLEKESAEQRSILSSAIASKSAVFTSTNPPRGSLLLDGRKVVWRQPEAVQTYELPPDAEGEIRGDPPSVRLKWVSISKSMYKYSPDSDDASLSAIRIRGEYLLRLKITDRQGRTAEFDFNPKGEPKSAPQAVPQNTPILSETELKSLVTDFYDQRSAFAGQYRMSSIGKIRVVESGKDLWIIHAEYTYAGTNGSKGTDQRTFECRRSVSGKLVIGNMGGNMSGRP